MLSVMVPRFSALRGEDASTGRRNTSSGRWKCKALEINDGKLASVQREESKQETGV